MGRDGHQRGKPQLSARAGLQNLRVDLHGGHEVPHDSVYLTREVVQERRERKGRMLGQRLVRAEKEQDGGCRRTIIGQRAAGKLRGNHDAFLYTIMCPKSRKYRVSATPGMYTICPE